jgi:hypothetical protein
MFWMQAGVQHEAYFRRLQNLQSKKNLRDCPEKLSLKQRSSRFERLSTFLEML